MAYQQDLINLVLGRRGNAYLANNPDLYSNVFNAGDSYARLLEGQRRKMMENERYFAQNTQSQPSFGSQSNYIADRINGDLNFLRAAVPGATFSVYDNKVYFQKAGVNEGKISTNLSLLRKDVGKTNPAYFSPAWSILMAYNKLGGGINRTITLSTKGISLETLQARSIKRAFTSTRYTTRRIARDQAFADKLKGRISQGLTKAEANLLARRAYGDTLFRLGGIAG